jgi:hypothetical protein
VELQKVAEKKNLNFHHQISNAFTTTSVFSLLTGKLPSQIFENGMGYDTDNLLKDDPRWNDSIIFDKITNNGWEVRFHNGSWMPKTMYNKQNFLSTSAYPGGYQKEYEMTWGKEHIEKIMIEDSEEAKLMLEREKEFINTAQNEKTDKNIFYFVIYHHYHSAVCQGQGYDTARKYMMELLEEWNCEEKDSIFWFFADHGDFKKIDNYCSPPHAINTWAISRNNIFNVNEKYKKLISIVDFYEKFNQIFADRYA